MGSIDRSGNQHRSMASSNAARKAVSGFGWLLLSASIASCAPAPLEAEGDDRAVVPAERYISTPPEERTVAHAPAVSIQALVCNPEYEGHPVAGPLRGRVSCPEGPVPVPVRDYRWRETIRFNVVDPELRAIVADLLEEHPALAEAAELVSADKMTEGNFFIRLFGRESKIADDRYCVLERGCLHVFADIWMYEEGNRIEIRNYVNNWDKIKIHRIGFPFTLHTFESNSNFTISTFIRKSAVFLPSQTSEVEGFSIIDKQSSIVYSECYIHENFSNLELEVEVQSCILKGVGFFTGVSNFALKESFKIKINRRE